MDSIVRLRRDITVTDTGAGLAFAAPWGTTTLTLPADLRAVVAGLAAADTAEADLPALLPLHVLLRRFDSAGWLEHAVLVDGTPAVRLRPVGSGPRPSAPLPDGPVKLSRFAVVHAEDDALVLRAPRSPFLVELGPAGLALVGELATWTESVSQPKALRLLADAGVLTFGGPDADPEQRPGVWQWSPADLWLHARTRGTRLSGGYGGTYAVAKRMDPLPARRSAFGGRRIALPVPKLAVIAAGDPPLTEAVERRRSVRAHGSAPVTVDQLGELLYRAVRQRHAFTAPDGQEVADRPYPCGGSVHELEVYPLIHACTGVDAGLWHYAAADHALEHVADPSPATARLLAGARGSAMMTADPQVTLIVAARFGRVRWKYETIAYALTLKHVGVLYQTVYLIATAMGLAVCGLGGGDADDFAAATGLDYHDEGSVGELVLGSAPDVPPAPVWPE